MNKYLIFDTETKSRNPELDKPNIHEHYPFMVSYVVADENLNAVYQDWFKITDMNKLNIFNQYLNECPTIVGANIKYDIHMMCNYDFNYYAIFDKKNYIEVEVLARLVIPTDTQDDPSFTVALKKLGKRYLDVNADEDEKIVKRELTNLNVAHKQLMSEELVKTFNLNLTKTALNELVNDLYKNDMWYAKFHLYPQYKTFRRQFFMRHPRPSYEDCPSVFKYGMNDALITHGLFKLWYKKAIELDQVNNIIEVSEAVMPLVSMEREGLTLNVKQLLLDREAIIRELDKEKIISPITGEELTAQQNAKLKEVYEFETGLKLTNADKNTRAKIMNDSPTAKIVSYKQSLLKYLNTYMTGLLKKLSFVNGEYKIYTQYHLAGTVTGRLSSDFQQFPKEPLELHDGTVVNIRSWFVVPKGYKYMLYFDYSQLELRLQCEWTSLIHKGVPDLNMCRAFMPYKCIEKDGKYYYEEEPDKEWTPTDLHALTAKTAFPDIDESHPDWKHYRKLGKSCNFACNYGASPAKIAESLDVDMPTAIKLVKGYKTAYKGVVDFGNWLKSRSYVVNKWPNLFKRYYYSRNAHKLQNYLVQGSGADLLLRKLRQTYTFIKTHPWWSYIITVHDEIGLTVKDIPIDQLKKEILEIQSIMNEKLSAVEIKADIEITDTDWGHKQDYDESLL